MTVWKLTQLQKQLKKRSCSQWCGHFQVFQDHQKFNLIAFCGLVLCWCALLARLTDTVWLGWTSTALWQEKNVRFLIKRNNWTSGYSDLVTKKSSATLIYGLIRMSPYKKGRVWWNHNYVFIFLTDSVKYLKPNMTQIPVWRGLPNQWWWSKKSKTHLKLTNSTLGSF